LYVVGDDGEGVIVGLKDENENDEHESLLDWRDQGMPIVSVRHLLLNDF
jgi:hypothetical protein